MVLSKEELVRRAIKSGETLKTLRLIQSLNVDVNCNRLPCGATFLHEAAMHKQGRIALLLLKLKAKPNKRCKKELTPLHIAISNNSIDIIKILLDYGANLNKKYKTKTPLQLAVEANQYVIAKILLEKGASIKLASGHPSLVEIARIHNNMELFSLLQEYSIKQGVSVASKLEVETTATAIKSKQRGEQSLRIWVLKRNALMSLQNNVGLQWFPQAPKKASAECVIL